MSVQLLKILSINIIPAIMLEVIGFASRAAAGVDITENIEGKKLRVGRERRPVVKIEGGEKIPERSEARTAKFEVVSSRIHAGDGERDFCALSHRITTLENSFQSRRKMG